jgi:hypothetical protein
MFLYARKAAFLEAFIASRAAMMHGFSPFVKNDERKISTARGCYVARAKVVVGGGAGGCDNCEELFASVAKDVSVGGKLSRDLLRRQWLAKPRAASSKASLPNIRFPASPMRGAAFSNAIPILDVGRAGRARKLFVT